jgi:hypothetical protein
MHRSRMAQRNLRLRLLIRPGENNAPDDTPAGLDKLPKYRCSFPMSVAGVDSGIFYQDVPHVIVVFRTNLLELS